MASGYISDTIVAGWLTTLRSSARYASVHYDIPPLADPSATEASDPGYARQLLYWTTESTRGITTAQPLVFPALSAMTVVAVGMWSALAGGTFAGYLSPEDWNSAAYLSSTGTLTIPAGEIGVRL